MALPPNERASSAPPERDAEPLPVRAESMIAGRPESSDGASRPTPPHGSRRPPRRPPPAPVLSDQEALLYDAYVVPRYAAVFGALLLRSFVPPPRAAILDAACGSGYPSLEILRRLDDHGRVVAIDRNPALVELASRKAVEAAGRRIFFRRGTLDELRFGDQVFDGVVVNLGLPETPDVAGFLAECFRVLGGGGQIVVTLPTAGTFQEVLDLLLEIAIKHDLTAVTDRVAVLTERHPPAGGVATLLESAGFERVAVQHDTFSLPVRSAAELFRDPVVRLVALEGWRWAAGGDAEGDRVLGLVERALETYFAGPFALTVHAACAVGWRPAG